MQHIVSDLLILRISINALHAISDFHLQLAWQLPDAVVIMLTITTNDSSTIRSL